MKMVDQHESRNELLLYQPNTFQMLPRYHAESWLPPPAMSKCVKILDIVITSKTELVFKSSRTWGAVARAVSHYAHHEPDVTSRICGSR
jgi:hypothetical protein